MTYPFNRVYRYSAPAAAVRNVLLRAAAVVESLAAVAVWLRHTALVLQ